MIENWREAKYNSLPVIRSGLPPFKRSRFTLAEDSSINIDDERFNRFPQTPKYRYAQVMDHMRPIYLARRFALMSR